MPEKVTSAAKDRVDGYIATINRLEPDISPTDQSAWGTSLAISLNRIADQTELLNKNLEHLNELIIRLTQDQREGRR